MTASTVSEMPPLSSAAFVANAHHWYALLREQGPLHRGEFWDNGLEVWLVTRHDDVRALLRDPRLASDYRAAWTTLKSVDVVREDDEPVDGAQWHSVVTADPPYHTRMRNVVRKMFAPRRIEEHRPYAQEVTDRLLDELGPQGSIELMIDFATPMTGAVIERVVGVPEGDTTLIDWWRFSRTGGPSIDRYEYFPRLLAAKRPHVDLDVPGDEQPDLCSLLIQAVDRVGAMSDAEAVNMLYAVTSGAHAVADMMLSAVYWLLMFPDQMELLRRRPELIESAVEELMRYASLIDQVILRIATDDIEVGGETIPAGAIVHLGLAPANHDPAAFEDPERLDITRDPNYHMGFGHGIHFCLGAALSRLELQVAVGSLVSRFPELAIGCPPEELRWEERKPVATGLGLCALPLRLGPRRDGS